MVTIHSVYNGSLRCTATHGPSQTVLTPDAPTDNQGLGESFSPTDLVATALATCAMTIMGILAQRHDLDLTGVGATVTKGMVSEPVRRISTLSVEIRLPEHLDETQRQQLENAARACPVAQSIHPNIRAEFMFRYGQAD